MSWAPILLLAAMGLAAQAKPQSQSQSQYRFALTPGQVARALCGKGMQTSDHQVSLPARVVATDPDPVLDVLSVDSPAIDRLAHASRVRLACHLPGQCLPFYAMVTGRLTASFSSALAGRGEFTMQAGARATLVMDDARAHIQVRVISLENGMTGKRIRVSSLDRKQVYFGEVVSASLLKGTF